MFPNILSFVSNKYLNFITCILLFDSQYYDNITTTCHNIYLIGETPISLKRQENVIFLNFELILLQLFFEVL